jgi:hypothetical protein
MISVSSFLNWRAGLRGFREELSTIGRSNIYWKKTISQPFTSHSEGSLFVSILREKSRERDY